MRELLQLLQIPPHFHHKVIEFRLKIVFNAIAKQLRKSAKHRQSIPVTKPNLFKVFDSGYELFFNATRKQVGVPLNLRNPNALEEIQSGSEPILHAASEQSGPPVYDPFKLGPINVGFPNQKRENRDDIGDLGGENFRAHSDNPPELDRRETHGGDEVNGGFDIGK